MRFSDCVRGTLTLTDGGWGTEFLRTGAQLEECLDHFNLTQPERVRRVAESYVRAGSRVLLTNTFRANPISLAHHGLREQCAAINRAGVRISREAAGASAMVFASIGPSGESLSTGEVTREQLRRAFSEQALALAAEGPDALLLETMIDLEEARIAAAAALATGLPVIVSFVFALKGKEVHTLSGGTLDRVVSALGAEGVHALGANCCDLRESIAICRQLAAASPLPIWMKPSAGLPELVDDALAYKTTPAHFASAAYELRDAGATFLGGCCGTTPEFIRALAGQLASQSTAARI